VHREQQAKTYAVDIETVSQGKRAIDYTDAQEYKLGNVKDPEKIKAKLEEKRSEARKKHALYWWLGRVVSIAFVDVYGDDPDVVFYGDSEAEILTKAYEYLNGPKLVGCYSDGFDYDYLRGRYMANIAEKTIDVGIPHSIRYESRFQQFDVNKIFGWSSQSSQRGKLNDYAHGLGLPLKPMTGESVAGLYETIIGAVLEGDKLTEDAAWKQLADYNLHDSRVTAAIARLYWPEGMNS
jgi:hypothetical protein